MYLPQIPPYFSQNSSIKSSSVLSNTSKSKSMTLMCQFYEPLLPTAPVSRRRWPPSSASNCVWIVSDNGARGPGWLDNAPTGYLCKTGTETSTAVRPSYSVMSTAVQCNGGVQLNWQAKHWGIMARERGEMQRLNCTGLVFGYVSCKYDKK